jgi:uncharacterized protein YndB with AHSA1/START domain
MTRRRFVYSIYINAPAEKIFHALTDGPTTREYWFHENVSDWKIGSKWSHRRLDGSADDVVGTVLENDPPHRLVTIWAAPAAPDDPAQQSRVTFEIEPVGGVCRLTVTHDELPPDQLDDAASGWSSVLSSLKSLLETGKSLGDLWSGRHDQALRIFAAPHFTRP